MMQPTVTVNGFLHDEENKLFRKTEFRVIYTLDYEAMSDFEYWHSRERGKGVQYPTLKDFAKEYKTHRKQGVEVVALPDTDTPEALDGIEQLVKKHKQDNWQKHVPQAGQTPIAGKMVYVFTENGIEYLGSRIIQDSVSNYWSQELGRFGNTPTLKGWFDSLSSSQKSAMELTKNILEPVI